MLQSMGSQGWTLLVADDDNHHSLDLCKLEDVYSPISSSIHPCYLHLTLEGHRFLLLLSPSLLSFT